MNIYQKDQIELALWRFLKRYTSSSESSSTQLLIDNCVKEIEKRLGE